MIVRIADEPFVPGGVIGKIVPAPDMHTNGYLPVEACQHRRELLCKTSPCRILEQLIAQSFLDFTITIASAGMFFCSKNSFTSRTV